MGLMQINGRHTAQSNEEFDAWLRTQNALNGAYETSPRSRLWRQPTFSRKTAHVPANNLSVIFERGP